MAREVIYRERANGRQEQWTYADGQRVYISQALADKMERQGADVRVVKP